MNPFVIIRAIGRALGVFTAAGVGVFAQPGIPSLTEGATVELAGRLATIRKLEALPYVESEFTRRFRFDTADNPKLRELRARYHLDAVVAPGRDEFDRQVLLLDWVHSPVQAVWPSVGRGQGGTGDPAGH